MGKPASVSSNPPPSAADVGTAEAAEALGIAPGTLTRWVRQGVVRPDARTLGGRARFTKRTVAAIARRMRESVGSDPAPA